MKKIFLLIVFSFSGVAFGAEYNAAVSWNDPTTADAKYNPIFTVEVMSPDSTVTVYSNVAAAPFNFQITDEPGATYQVRVKTTNTISGLESAYTSWVAGVTGAAPITPETPNGISFTITLVP